MTETQSKARIQAEAAFGKTQSQFLARSRIISENDAVVQERDEKTMRLRALRMAKEAGGTATPDGMTPANPAKD